MLKISIEIKSSNLFNFLKYKNQTQNFMINRKSTFEKKMFKITNNLKTIQYHIIEFISKAATEIRLCLQFARITQWLFRTIS